jgi:flagellar biosynthetic protein FlhB
VADEGGDKTEEPTEKKLGDARKKGQVSKSRDLTGALVFMVGFFVIAAMFPWTLQQFKQGFYLAFSKIGTDITPEDVATACFHGLYSVLIVSLPAIAAAAMIGALADFLQVGALFTLEPLMPKLDKLNPLEGMKNLVSKKQLVELLKSTVKLLLAGYIAWGVLRDELGLIAATARADAALILVAGGRIMYRLSTRIALIFILFAIFDVWWQRRTYMKDMMMTKDEVKREYKESEGDPHHKAKRKEMHQEILEEAAMNDVGSADVIVTNPEHYAVAVRYDKEQDNAPRVVAKGIDSKAARIREIAQKAGVPLMRNVPLAHALYRIDVGDEIPEALYDAVAEVLNFVYAEQRKRELA